MTKNVVFQNLTYSKMREILYIKISELTMILLLISFNSSQFILFNLSTEIITTKIINKRMQIIFCDYKKRQIYLIIIIKLKTI